MRAISIVFVLIVCMLFASTVTAMSVPSSVPNEEKSEEISGGYNYAKHILIVVLVLAAMHYYVKAQE